MAGRRAKSYRSGDLNEDLGVFLLKAFSVVAPVPRPEDVGIDAVATLLREGEHNLLFAEDSFYVQFKSASDRRVVYKDHEVDWLMQLKLPLFIGSVDRAASTVELYTTHRLTNVLVEEKYSEIRLELDRVDESSGPGDVRLANISPPLLKWNVSDLANDDFAERAYRILKPVVVAEQRNIYLRPIQCVETIHWQTNEIPQCNVIQMSVFHPDQLPSVLKVFSTPLFSLVADAALRGDREDMDTLLRVSEYLLKHTKDENLHRTAGMFKGVMEHRLAQQGQP